MINALTSNAIVFLAIVAVVMAANLTQEKNKCV